MATKIQLTEEMQTLFSQATTLMDEIKKDFEKGSKASMKRFRVKSSNLAKVLKELRKLTKAAKYE